jgi:hypothetical protein
LITKKLMIGAMLVKVLRPLSTKMPGAARRRLRGSPMPPISGPV